MKEFSPKNEEQGVERVLEKEKKRPASGLLLFSSSMIMCIASYLFGSVTLSIIEHRDLHLPLFLHHPTGHARPSSDLRSRLIATYIVCHHDILPPPPLAVRCCPSSVTSHLLCASCVKLFWSHQAETWKRYLSASTITITIAPRSL